MFNPKTNYAKIAYDAILFFVTTGQVKKTDQSKITSDLKLNRACIVSIYDANDQLKSSYGDIEPETENLYDEIVENSIKAATVESEEPISTSELANIKVYVDVLSVPNIVEDFSELKPHKHGLYIKDKKGKNGFILPNKKGVKTYEKQIELIKKNTGIKDKTEDLEIKYFKTTRYD